MSTGKQGRQYDFDLAGGRRIQMLELHQRWTYSGLLVGRPSPQVNRRIMDQMIADCSGRSGGGAVLLLEPIPTPLELPGAPSHESATTALPAAACAARFRSDKLAGDDESSASVLWVVWFQDDFAFPIDPMIQTEIEAIDWEAHSVGWRP